MFKKRFLILFLICFIGRGSAPGAAAPKTVVPQAVVPKTVVLTAPSKQVVKSSPVAPKVVTVKKTVPTQTPLPSITQAPSPTQPQAVDFSQCTKGFKLDKEKLFYLTLAAVNANRFSIQEIQSNSGYVTFSVGKRQFLASVIDMGPQNSMLKITPFDSAYYFPVGIVQNMFKYVELNVALKIEQLSIL